MSREKATLIVYSDGRIQIPKLIRERLKILPNELLTIRVEKGEIILTPLKKKCIICEKEYGLRSIDGQYMCIDCVEKVVDAWQKVRF